MKENIHPKYYPKANVRCACGNAFTVGSTKEFLEVEICSKCHPFYTGKEKLMDTMGRVEKFRKRLAKKQELKKKPASAKAASLGEVASATKAESSKQVKNA